MRAYEVKDKVTKSIIGIVEMTPEQARKAEQDVIVVER